MTCARPGIRGLGYFALAAAALATAGACLAQPAYPTRPIRLIVPYPPGGPTDIVGRLVNEALAKRLGQPVVIDNRGGAATAIGSELVARSTPDGYTLLVANETTLSVNPVVTPNLRYHPERDFAPIGMIAAQPYLLAVHPSVPATSVSQLIAYAKANPGRVTYASAGSGSGAHFAGAMFNHIAGIDTLHVPYRGAAPAVVDLLAGQVNLMFASLSILYPHGLSGKLRVLGVTSTKRSPLVPEYPTVAEGGASGFQWGGFSSLVAPRATPRPVIDRVNRELNSILTDPAFAERARKQSIDPNPTTPEQLAAHIKSELARLQGLIKATGLKVETD